MNPGGRLRVGLATALLPAVVLAGLAGCGRERPSLSAAAAEDLAAKVSRVRMAAAAADETGARTALASVRQAVADGRGSGQISEDRAARILSAAAEVESRLGLLPDPVPASTPTTPRRPVVQEGDEKEDEEEEENKGKGKGKKKD